MRTSARRSNGMIAVIAVGVCALLLMLGMPDSARADDPVGGAQQTLVEATSITRQTLSAQSATAVAQRETLTAIAIQQQQDAANATRTAIAAVQTARAIQQQQDIEATRVAQQTRLAIDTTATVQARDALSTRSAVQSQQTAQVSDALATSAALSAESTRAAMTATGAAAQTQSAATRVAGTATANAVRTQSAETHVAATETASAVQTRASAIETAAAVQQASEERLALIQTMGLLFVAVVAMAFMVFLALVLGRAAWRRWVRTQAPSGRPSVVHSTGTQTVIDVEPAPVVIVPPAPPPTRLAVNDEACQVLQELVELGETHDARPDEPVSESATIYTVEPTVDRSR